MFVFFGAGRIGKKMLEFCRYFSVEPSYFVDNNSELWGEKIENIEVISLERCLKKKEVTYIITCLHSDLIMEQLQSCGINSNNIIKTSSETTILDYIKNLDKFSPPQKQEPKVLFDLFNGLVLGGVETWSIQTAGLLESIGYKTCLSLNISEPKILETKREIIPLDVKNSVLYCLNQIIQAGVKYIICNFPAYNFELAYFLKKIYGEQIKLIVVIHNDEDMYYNKYVPMEKYIDICLVISKRIQKELLKRGFSAEKCKYLPWEIRTPMILNRNYEDKKKPICIGYAGRLTIRQKRIDLLLDIVKKLEERNVSYRLQLAGNGDYESPFFQKIQEMGCGERVKYMGFIIPDSIPQFWAQQDIMITCSEFEGHSISQCEAMAQGVVPIITDTSGARDDVVDGENGFIVPVGAIDEIVEKICYLNENRELLRVMGRKAYETIKLKNNRESLIKLWNEVLKE